MDKIRRYPPLEYTNRPVLAYKVIFSAMFVFITNFNSLVPESARGTRISVSMCVRLPTRCEA